MVKGLMSDTLVFGVFSLSTFDLAISVVFDAMLVEVFGVWSVSKSLYPF